MRHISINQSIKLRDEQYTLVSIHSFFTTFLCFECYSNLFTLFLNALLHSPLYTCINIISFLFSPFFICSSFVNHFHFAIIDSIRFTVNCWKFSGVINSHRYSRQIQARVNKTVLVPVQEAKKSNSNRSRLCTIFSQHPK